METTEAKSSGSKNKWLIGLGIGCGGVVILVIVLFIAGYHFVKNISQGFEVSESLAKSLAQKYGRAEDYVPNPDGTIPAGRVEVFLAVREAAAPFQKKLEASFEELSRNRNPRDTDVRPSRNVLAAIRQGIGIVPQVSDFLKARNQALSEKGMGLGEYDYLYVMAFYSWLKKSPSDGPGFQVIGPGNEAASSNSEEATEVRRDLMIRRIQRLVLPMMQKQLAGLEAGGESAAKTPWHKSLAAEVKALEADRYRVPWQDGLPGVIADSLAPFRERLESVYGRMTNILEFGYERR